MLDRIMYVAIVVGVRSTPSMMKALSYVLFERSLHSSYWLFGLEFALLCWVILPIWGLKHILNQDDEPVEYAQFTR